MRPYRYVSWCGANFRLFAPVLVLTRRVAGIDDNHHDPKPPWPYDPTTAPVRSPPRPTLYPFPAR